MPDRPEPPEVQAPPITPPNAPPVAVAVQAASAVLSQMPLNQAIATLLAMIAMAVYDVHKDLSAAQAAIIALNSRVAALESSQITREEQDGLQQSIREIERNIDARVDRVEQDQARADGRAKSER